MLSFSRVWKTYGKIISFGMRVMGSLGSKGGGGNLGNKLVPVSVLKLESWTLLKSSLGRRGENLLSLVFIIC